MLRLLAALWLAALALGGHAADGLVPVPPLAARVTDLSGTLSREQAASLEAGLAQFEQSRGSQIAILLVPTTKPEAIEAYSIRVAESWKLGRRGIDDGLLILVARDDRRLRIEVGRGLEGAVPDAVAKRIVAEVIGPRFREGDYYGGLQAGVARLQAAIGGEALPPARVAQANLPRSTEDNVLTLLGVLVMSLFLRSMFGLLGALLGAFLAGLLAWLAFASWIIAAIAALLAFLLSFARLNTRSQYASGGGHTGGGWDGGASGGGFSGGGGDFGGGGASGDW